MTMPPSAGGQDGLQERLQDRLLVKDGFRHYRRRYSRAEVRWGLGCGVGLLAIFSWIAWRGSRPDPSLFEDEIPLLATNTTPAVAAAPAVTPAPATVPPAAPKAATAGAADRGPLPAGLAGAGFREDKVAVFDDENLYVKINGRADYFKAFGFRKLYSSLLVSDADPAVTIDIEMYDLAQAANALGAYGGERAAGVTPEVDETGMHHFDRNAVYLAQGPYYVRVIGSDESAAVQAKLRTLQGTLAASIKGEPLPWAYGLFVGRLGFPPGSVSYSAEGAFSFSFATDVWSARPEGKDSDLELFVCSLVSSSAAKKRAAQFQKGFLEIGQPGGTAAGVPLAKDQFLSTFSAALAVDRWVVGVRGAASAEAVSKGLDGLRAALVQLPADLKERARPAAASRKTEGGSYE